MTIDTSREAVERLLDGVTPGPWASFIDDTGGEWSGWPLCIDATTIDDKTVVRTGGQWPYEWGAKTSQHEACQNARFIAASRDLVPVLLAERDAALADVARLSALLRAEYERGVREAADKCNALRDHEDTTDEEARGAMFCASDILALLTQEWR